MHRNKNENLKYNLGKASAAISILNNYLNYT
jgi:hypothetical protein